MLGSHDEPDPQSFEACVAEIAGFLLATRPSRK
ncbi:hypothetical protein PPSIR1_06571 [Plesiocystis pacifica SIR-1]|uniref:Uncharacterized protein n=1 Tax=Plesiocystis pacifica SIR-1 TaxID=391625 RepID=A6GHG8_9BACT|nr:hypothetical protein PPSIR1_06571 [Plesiocystis pacifica SIR-1]